MSMADAVREWLEQALNDESRFTEPPPVYPCVTDDGEIEGRTEEWRQREWDLGHGGEECSDG